MINWNFCLPMKSRRIKMFDLLFSCLRGKEIGAIGDKIIDQIYEVTPSDQLKKDVRFASETELNAR